MYERLTIDIETIGGRPEDAERHMRLNWSPSPNWKAETIGKKYLEQHEKKLEKLAVIDGSHTISTALKGTGKDGVELRCLHCMYAHEPRMFESALVEGFATEREMLIALRALLAATVDGATLIAGHNILEFDISKLRLGYLSADLTLPQAMVANQPVFDTMKAWPKFSYGCKEVRDGNGKKKSHHFYSVGDVCEVLGIPHHKDVASGRDIGALHAAGKFDAIIRYNLLDVQTEDDVVVRLLGQKPDGEPIAERPKADLANLPVSTAGAA